MEFDPKILVSALEQDALTALGQANQELMAQQPPLRAAWQRLQDNARATLVAISQQTDKDKAASLVEDLEKTLPDSTEAILEWATSLGAGASRRAWDSALEGFARTVVIVAKAFLKGALA